MTEPKPRLAGDTLLERAAQRFSYAPLPPLDPSLLKGPASVHKPLPPVPPLPPVSVVAPDAPIAPDTAMVPAIVPAVVPAVGAAAVNAAAPVAPEQVAAPAPVSAPAPSQAPVPTVAPPAPTAAPTPAVEPVVNVAPAAADEVGNDAALGTSAPNADAEPAGAPARQAAPVGLPLRREEMSPVPDVAASLPLVTPAPKPVHDRRLVSIDRTALSDAGMIVPGGTITPLAEEFRMIKRHLLLTAKAVAAGSDAKAADRARMILVCAPNPNEGKTFCAVNLALSMSAEKDVEILLVDADFVKPDVLERLGIEGNGGQGLLDGLTGAIDNVEDCIIETDIPQLSVLPAGTRSVSDAELLASDRAHAMIDGLASANPRRIVIFDSPPALAASLASVIALHVGQVMLVVRADQTSEGDLRQTVSTLDGCEHVQLVLNSTSYRANGRRFGSYYGEAGK